MDIEKLKALMKSGERVIWEYADLRGADLRGADLRGADLTGADLRGADLRGADLRGADLTGADLRDADLTCADLRGADLTGADLTGANLRRADLRGADLRGADLTDANLTRIEISQSTRGLELACPEEGPFVAFKKAGDKIVVLEIPADAKRSSAATLKCRCNKAKVLRIENLDGSISESNQVPSNYDPNFIYKVGETVKVDNFDENRWQECSTGIHFFLNKQNAVFYNAI